MIGYEYKGKSRIFQRGQEVAPSDLLYLPSNTIKHALKWGIIREIKIKEDAKKKERGQSRKSRTKKRDS